MASSTDAGKSVLRGMGGNRQMMWAEFGNVINVKVDSPERGDIPANVVRNSRAKMRRDLARFKEKRPELDLSGAEIVEGIINYKPIEKVFIWPVGWYCATWEPRYVA